MRLTPNLSFGGQCEAAFKFYERCFGAKIVFMLTYDKSPMAEQVPLGWREKIFHATLTVGLMTLWMQNGYFTRLRKTAQCKCPFRKPSGPSALACLRINSVYPGRSTASKRPA